MRKTFLYLLIVVLFLLTPVCIMGLLGTAVSKKYEVDESYWLIEANEKLTDEQKNFQRTQLDKEGDALDTRMILFLLGGLASSSLATFLLVKTIRSARQNRNAVL